MNEAGTITAEQSLIGACLLAEKAPPISLEDFSRADNREIAKVMRELDKKGIVPDLPTVGEHLNREITSSSYLAQVFDRASNPRNIEVYARIVKESARARRVRLKAEHFLAELGSPAGKGPKEALNGLRAELNSADCDTSEDCGMKEGMSALVESIEERIISGRQVGISTGIQLLDQHTSGMAKQDLWVLAARPSQGKTALALQIARHIAGDGKHVLFFSLDMSRNALYERLLATEATINLAKIKSANLRPHEFSDILTAALKLESLPITIIDKPSTEIEIIDKSRAILPDVIFVDHLTKVIPSSKTGNANHDYGEISNALKNLAKTMDIPVVVLSQLSRLNEREGRPPRESDLRDSGEIEQDADLILFIHSKDKALPERELIIAKQRQGQLARMKFRFDGAHQRFDQVGS